MDANSSEYKAFIQAAMRGDRAEVDKYLSTYPHFLDLPTTQGNSPLLLAAWQGSDSVVELLLERGSISLDSPGGRRNTPLHWAAASGRDSTIELLMKRGSTSLDATDIDGNTPLHSAAAYGHDSTVELLLKLGSTSIESGGNRRWNLTTSVKPLYLAAEHRKFSIVRTLKAAGAIVPSVVHMAPSVIAALQEPIPEDEILEIRYRIYFRVSLLSWLLF